MDIISLNEASTANGRIEKFIENPDSTSGIITVPKVIASGENITVPAGRVAVLPNVQVDGTLNVQGDVFIPSGATLSGVVEKVPSTDNAVVRFNGTTGAVQNSGVIIDDNDNIGIGVTPSADYKLYTTPNYTGSANIGTVAIGASGANYGSIGYNFRTTDTSYNYLYNVNDLASMIRFNSGGFHFLTAPSGTAGNAISWTNAMTLNSSGNLLVGTTTDNGVDKLQVNGSISAMPPSFGIQQQVNNHRKLYCFFIENPYKNRLKLTISGNPTYLSFVLNIVYSNLYSATNESAIREYSFKRVAIFDTTNFSEIGTGLGSSVTVISSNIVTGGYEVVLGFNAGGNPQFDIEIINHQYLSSGTITGEFLTV